MLKKILVPIDGTEYSWRAMEYAASLAKRRVDTWLF